MLDWETFTVMADDAGRRLDRVLRKLLPGASLTRIYSALRRGEARVNGSPRPADYRVRAEERISLSAPLAAAGRRARPPVSRLPPPDVASMVVYRCRDFVVFNKPRGLAVHGVDSLASAAMAWLAPELPPSLSFRPGPVHRLDKDTSGLVLFAASLAGAQTLSALLRDRACEKTYLALLEGELRDAETWEDALERDREAGRTVADPDGQPSIAHAEPLLSRRGLTLARVRLVSGRTHQIRAQAALRGRPLAGDTRYGGSPSPDGYVLHACRFRLPEGAIAADRTLFTAPLPAASRAALERAFGAPETTAALAEA